MLNAFGASTSQVFGNVTTRRLFTLYQSDITSGAIFNMLPGGGKPKAIDLDNSSPYSGASYQDKGSWSLVPIEASGPKVGTIKNSLLAQTITLWFNLRSNANLGGISLQNDTLITRSTSNCGSNSPAGASVKFGLPHVIVVYLNSANGYPATINGLFQLANDVLGGVNTSVTAADVEQAVDVINNAFDECRILVGTIPYSAPVTLKESIQVLAYPNPYTDRFNLVINPPLSGLATIEFFGVNGGKVYEMKQVIPARLNTTITYPGPLLAPTLLYKVTMDKYHTAGIVIKLN